MNEIQKMWVRAYDQYIAGMTNPQTGSSTPGPVALMKAREHADAVVASLMKLETTPGKDGE